jgi:hypothetical protein
MSEFTFDEPAVLVRRGALHPERSGSGQPGRRDLNLDSGPLGELLSDTF